MAETYDDLDGDGTENDGMDRDDSAPAVGRQMSLANVEQAMRDAEHEEGHDPKIFVLYWKMFKDTYAPNKKWTCRHTILLVWGVLLFLGAIFGPQLMSHTSMNTDAPQGSEAAHARHRVKRYFPDVIDVQHTIVLVEVTDAARDEYGEDVDMTHPDTLGPFFQNLTESFKHRIWSWNNKSDDFDIIYEFNDYFDSVDNCYDEIDASDAYLLESCLNGVKAFYVSEKTNQSSMYIIAHKDKVDDWTKRRYVLHSGKISRKETRSNNGYFRVRVTGQWELLWDAQQAANESIHTDMLFIPLILLILAYTLKSWRLLVIPFIVMISTVAIAFMVLIPVSLYILVFEMAVPPLMMSVAMAMSIDYTLFLLVRFKEEVGMERLEITRSEVLNAVKQTMHWSGEVVLLSGVILALSMVAYLFSNMGFLMAYGTGVSTTLFIAIVCSMTLVPALLLQFPAWFSHLSFGVDCKWRKVKVIDDYQGLSGSDDHDDDDEERGGKETEMATASTYGTGAGDVMTSNANDDPAASKDKKKGDDDGDDSEDDLASVGNDPLWDPWPLNEAESASQATTCCYKCGVWTTLWPVSLIVILIVYALILPFSIESTNLSIQYSQTTVFPYDSKPYAVVDSLAEEFGAGIMAPFYVLFKNPTGQNVFKNFTFINDTAHMFKEFYLSSNGTVTELTSILGPSVLGTTFLTDELEWLDLNGTRYYHSTVSSTVSETDGSRTLFNLIPLRDGYGMDCQTMVARFRSRIESRCNDYGYACTVYGPSVEYADSVTDVYEKAPWIILATFIAVFTLAGFHFKNKVLPFRLFLTIAMPISLIFGFAVLIYQRGVFNWMGYSNLSSTGGLAWVVPVMVLTFMLGLALDYDIFLFARIDEYTHFGVPLRPAVVRAVTMTGTIITSAGLIMAFAFMGLFFSPTAQMNQVGFIMVSSVLVDTFIIRTTLVPSILSINTHGMTWWPYAKEKWDAMRGVPSSSASQRSAPQTEMATEDASLLATRA